MLASPRSPVAAAAAAAARLAAGLRPARHAASPLAAQLRARPASVCLSAPVAAPMSAAAASPSAAACSTSVASHAAQLQSPQVLLDLLETPCLSKSHRSAVHHILAQWAPEASSPAAGELRLSETIGSILQSMSATAQH